MTQQHLIDSAAALSKNLLQISEMSGGGVLRLLLDEEPRYELVIKKGKLLSIQELGSLTQNEVANVFHEHGLVSEKPLEDLTSYEALWEWVAKRVPKTLGMHRERFRDLLYHMTLRKLFQITYERSYSLSMSSDLPPIEDIMPKISLKDATEQLNQMQTKKITALSPNAKFTAISEIDSDISFEASLLYYLVRNKDRGLISIIQESFFTPDMTVFVLKELVGEKQVKKLENSDKNDDLENERTELELLDVIQSINRSHNSALKRDTSIQVAPEQIGERLDQALGDDRRFTESFESFPEIEGADLGISSGNSWNAGLKNGSRGVQVITLMSGLSYLALIISISIPYFFWQEFFQTFLK